MSIKNHGVLEDISAEIGYTATSALVDWLGGNNLFVPATADESHPIAKIIGMPAYTRLVNAWGGEFLWIPLGYEREKDRRDRMIVVMLASGFGVREVAKIAGMSKSHVEQTHARVVAMGILPFLLRRAGLDSIAAKYEQKTPRKTRGENYSKKRPGKPGG